jgi:hypothetical protein
MLTKRFLFFLMVLLISFAGCTLPNYKKLTAMEIQAELREVVNTIKAQPDWLEPSRICPIEVIPDTEKEVNYLDEGCENSPKLCFERCRKDDGNACYALALSIQKKLNTETPETVPLFLRSCKLGIISGCTNAAAGRLSLNAGDKSDAKCEADAFEKTCRMNDAWGCTMYGKLLAQGFGREQNLEEAVVYLQKACSIHGIEDDACKNAMMVKEQIEQAKQKNQKNDGYSNTKTRTRSN